MIVCDSHSEEGIIGYSKKKGNFICGKCLRERDMVKVSRTIIAEICSKSIDLLKVKRNELDCLIE